MSEQSAEHILGLSTISSDIMHAKERLGRTSVGVALLQNVIPPKHLSRLQQEIQEVPIETMTDKHAASRDEYDTEFVQNYWSYHLSLESSDSSTLNSFQRLRSLARAVNNLVSLDIGEHYQRLRTWQSNKLSVRLYDRQDGIGYNRFPASYQGIVAVASIDGDSELHARDDYGRSAMVTVEPGDIVLIRGSNLFSSNDPPMFVPDYSVKNIEPGGHTALILYPKTGNHAPSNSD